MFLIDLCQGYDGLALGRYSVSGQSYGNDGKQRAIIILDGKGGPGGASRHTGGRDERPPQNSSPALNRKGAGERWIPPSSKRNGPQASTEDKNDVIFRKVRGILNKITPERFDKLGLELLNVGITSQLVLKGIILLIFEKALDEPKYSPLYAQLCHRLCEDAPNFEPSNSTISTFRRLLLNKCQDEFENRSKAAEDSNVEVRSCSRVPSSYPPYWDAIAAVLADCSSAVLDKKDGPLSAEEEEQYAMAKRKMLGNIKFVGELGKLEMLHEGILHRCIKQLLEKKKKVAVQDMSEDLECLCQIMTTVGRRLDQGKAKLWMDQYFDRMKSYQANQELPARIRFMLQDVIELRENKWKPRRSSSDSRPKTIREVRQEAAKDFGVQMPLDGLIGSPPSMDFFRPMNGNFGPHSGPGSGGGSGGGGMADVFGPMPTGSSQFLGPGSIGTGPGVISLDAFSSSYSNSRGRSQQNQGYQRQYDKFDKSSKFEGRGGQEGRVSPRFQQQQQQRSHSSSPQQNQSSSSPRQHNQQRTPQHHQDGRELPPRFRRMQQQQQQHDTSKGQDSTPERAHDDWSPPVPHRQFQPPPQSDSVLIEPARTRYPPNSEEISLRPSRNFTPMFRPNTPSMLPKSAQSPQMPFPGSQNMRGMVPLPDPKPNPIMHKQPQVKIRQVTTQEKPKPVKKAAPTKEELKQNTENLLKNYLENGNLEEAVTAARDMRAPNKYLPELVSYFILHALDKSDSDRENVSKLITELKSASVITSEAFMEGFSVVVEQMSDLEAEVPLVKSYVAKFAACAASGAIITLAELAEPMENGAHYPLFLLCLQQLSKLQDKEWICWAFNDSKIDLQSMLPECDRNKDRMMEILEDRSLSFLFPLLRVQNDLWKQLRADPSAANIYKWVKENVDPKLYTNPGFVSILISNISRHVTSETTLAQGVDSTAMPDKALQEKEKELLDKYRGILQRFLNEKVDLQVMAIYSLQVFCHGHSFPKGMLLRMFMYMYDHEVIEEEAFLKWKEEVNDEYPGKGKALFQVNQWLTWLETAEEESDDED